MKLDDIKAAVELGIAVQWKTPDYRVVKDFTGVHYVSYRDENFIALTWSDEKTLNGDEKDFRPVVPPGSVIGVMGEAGIGNTPVFIGFWRTQLSPQGRGRLNWGYAAGDPDAVAWFIYSYRGDPPDYDEVVDTVVTWLELRGAFQSEDSTAPALVIM